MIVQRHNPTADKLRVALAHDWLVGMRGGEQVLDRLARLFGPTDLYTLVSNGAPLTDAISNCRIITSPLQQFPGAVGPWRRHYFPLMPWAVEHIRVSPGSCDMLISTSSAVMKSITPPPGVPHICYCHSPARYAWDLTDDYSRGSGGLIRRVGLRLVRDRFRAWDRRTADRVTRFLANSTFTAQRIKSCYGRDADVIHPPVRTQFFTHDPTVPRENWFLIASALEPYKRVDLAIDAAKRAGFSLKIVGDGTQRARLQSIAGTNVEFLGRVPDESLRDLYRRARALIFPQVEDFGIIAAEAQACGCPVMAFGRGGVLDIITPETGIYFHRQTPEALVEAVSQFDEIVINPRHCHENAVRFSENRFDEAILRCVAECAQN
jgi:glycosyltransferase involved in cell wall biosynthesis